MFDYTGFSADAENNGWVKGWIVFDDESKSFVTIFKTEDEASDKTEELGKPYAYSYGSHVPNTDEYIIDSYEA